MALLRSVLWLAAATSLLQAAPPVAEYALVLSDASVAAATTSRQALDGVEARGRLQGIRAAQRGVRAELARRNVRIVGSAELLLNAVFVSIPRDRAGELAGIPGVARVQYLPPLRRHLDRALDLVKVQQAWNTLGGASSAGAGVKIGIIDTGIDQNHPGFQDASLSPPSGFPKGDTGFTNSKVVVARSYVGMLPAPDDQSPRDRVGHGTAIAMIAAGVRNTGPAATIQGVAPKALLGNYKVFGSPGVNDYTLYSAVSLALEDALRDGMDIVTLSLGEGDPATYGPLDSFPECGDGRTAAACDIRAQAVETAIRNGLTVVVSAGNDGDTAAQFPALNTVHSPGTAPSAITVGASTNSHAFFQAVRASGAGVPGNLKNMLALFGDGPKLASPLTAPVRDVARLQSGGPACAALPAGSLSGAVALVRRGGCAFNDKINYAQQAGAAGVLMFQTGGPDTPFRIQGVQDTGIPVAAIGSSDGAALQAYVASSSDAAVTLDPALAPTDTAADTVARFSSRGPAIGTYGVKPELVAVGTDLYTATQKFDPNGNLYHASGYSAANGTSYAVPLVAGAAALVKQKHGDWKPAQIKSALVNTATQDVTDSGGRARVTAVGAGKLNAGDAVNAVATFDPAAISFGVITESSVNVGKTLKIFNSGAAAEFKFAVVPPNAAVTLSNAAKVIQPGADSIIVTLQGSRPNPGAYEGFIEITGPGPTMRVPYLYLVGDGRAFNIFPLVNGGFVGGVGDTDWFLGFKLIDQYGVPVAAQPVTFSAVPGGGTVTRADTQTDPLGIAGAFVNLGAKPGDQIFTATAGGLTAQFNGYARAIPTVAASGVVNAASFQVGSGLSPGSYVSVLGSALAEATRVTSTASLPLSLAAVSVSFDDAPANPTLSLPGRLHFVSSGQINVQIPWEFQGKGAAWMTLSAGGIVSSAYRVPLNDFSPGIFEYNDVGVQSAAVLDESYKVVGQANPAKRGRAVQIYVNGLGPVDKTLQPASGEPTPAQPLVWTSESPTVTIGGRAAQVIFNGLAPGNVGLYQVNAIVPADAGTGLQPVVVSIHGVDSKAANMPVQ